MMSCAHNKLSADGYQQTAQHGVLNNGYWWRMWCAMKVLGDIGRFAMALVLGLIYFLLISSIRQLNKGVRTVRLRFRPSENRSAPLKTLHHS